MPTSSPEPRTRRVAYSLEHVEKRVGANRAGEPNAIIFLTCALTGRACLRIHPQYEQAVSTSWSRLYRAGGFLQPKWLSAAAISRRFPPPVFWRAFSSAPGGRVCRAADASRMQCFWAARSIGQTGWTGGPLRKATGSSIPTTRGIIAATFSLARLIGTETEHLRCHLDVPARTWCLIRWAC